MTESFLDSFWIRRCHFEQCPCGPMRLAARLLAFVREHRLGTVLNGGFELLALPRTIRVPDIAFISVVRASRAQVPAGFVKICSTA